MRCLPSVVAGLAVLLLTGPLGAQEPPQRVGAPPAQKPTPQSIELAQAPKASAGRASDAGGHRAGAQGPHQRLDRGAGGRPPRGRADPVRLRACPRARRRRQHAGAADRHARPLRQRLRPALPARGGCGHRLWRRARPFQGQARVRQRLAAHQLPHQPVPLGGPRLRAAGDQVVAGPRRQGGELQYPGHGSGLLRTDHLQAARHRHQGNVHSPQHRHGEDAARAKRSRPRSGSRRSRWRPS